MKFWETKEEWILAAMHRVLTERGYVQTLDDDSFEKWRNGGVEVDLIYVHSTHDPIVAAVSLLRDDSSRARNAKALGGLLDRAEALVRLRAAREKFSAVDPVVMRRLRSEIE